MFLCMGDYNSIIKDGDVSMGDIDVWKILKELKNKGLVKSYSDHKEKRIAYEKRFLIMKSYRENCLLSEIDKDFFIQVASDQSIETYVWEYCRRGDSSIESEDIGPITTTRLIVEGHGRRLPYSVIAKLPDFFLDDEEVFGMFGKFWCKARNTNPLSDQIPDEKIKNFYSASTILSGLKNELIEMQLSEKKWSILISILMSENYSVRVSIPWEEKRKIIQQTFKAIEDGKEGNTEENFVLLKELGHCDKLITVDKENNKVYFVSEEIRHQVMGYFVLNCLESERDYENYLNLSSVDSIFEYARPWSYKRSLKERCVYLPEGTEKSFIERLGIDAIKFAADIYNFKYKISSKLHIPREVLKWDYDARCRYIACAKKGTQTMHRARAMIVGCAGAGKTTLLKRLQQRDIQELRQIQSTVGLEVYENLFDIDRDRKCLKGLEEDVDTENKCLLSVVDFAGQCAYYACHQVYLSRRAFYLLVIDMSKKFDEKVDQALCEQEGTMFADWTFGQYVIFWLKSIHTYCEDDTPVVTIATHSDEVQNMVNRSIYDDLLELLKHEPDLKKHLDRERCFHIGFPKDDNEHLDKLTNVVECIVSIALEDRWRESIPKEWALCEVVLRENKQKGKKCLSLTDFRKQVSIKKIGKEKETFDVLQFYHDIGVILYYNEDNLKDRTITDVQWFVDCFKYIITDPKHARDLVENDKDWKHFFESGYLSEGLLKGIWKKKKMDARKCNSTLKYMQRLGLLAVGEDAHYVPCMNKLDFGEHLKSYVMQLEQKTCVLVFNFRFLPYFFYFRLIVACIVSTKWTVIEDNGQKCLFKNIALFTFKEHTIGVAVTTSTIQVQIFRQGNKQLSGEITMKIKKTMEDVLKQMTKNFHKKTLYEIGYQCSKQDVTEEDPLCFISEKELVGRGEFSCPNHGFKNHHEIKENDLLRFWKYGKMKDSTEVKDGQENQKREEYQALFRKEDDDCLRVKEQEVFYLQKWHQSIGNLTCRTINGTRNGTAFRVGKRYLMTAYHVIRDTVDYYLEKVIELAQCDPVRKRNYSKLLKKLQVERSDVDVEVEIRNGIEMWMNKSCHSILFSDLIEALDVSGFFTTKEQASKMNEDLISVDFSCTREQGQSVFCPLKGDIPFYSKADDVALLEVNGGDFSCPEFILDCSNKKPNQVHIVGFPSLHNGEKIIDSKCRLIPSKESWPHFDDAVKWWNDKFPRENQIEFKNTYETAFSGNGKVQLNCSESTTHGASGSPGLIFSDKEKPKVFLMLQEGFPSFAYSEKFKEQLKIIPKRYLVESGISMSRVYELLSPKPLLHLRNELFHPEIRH
ncbi:uncharacterized protein LOC134273186 [Saccostrea cucullata]|uniref:uncharacterized protein LOC134273186 n=1 Tax=Saccostrea cuccullata TaxID=36930 RepID=UPI002ED31645